MIKHLGPEGTYVPAESSRFLPVRADEVLRWIRDEDSSDEIDWELRLREWRIRHYCHVRNRDGHGRCLSAQSRGSPRNKFILAIRRRVWCSRGHAPALWPPVPWRD